VTAVSLPVPDPKSQGFFMKLGQRRAMTISKVSIAVLITIAEGIVEKIRIALGAVAPTVIRSHETEQFLIGKKAADANVIEEAMKIISKECHPIDDVRSPAWYRCQMTGILLKRALETLLCS